MNSRILNKVVLQSLRHGHCRYLSVQQNVNKLGSTCHTVNFRRRKENHSSSFIFTKISNDRTLCQSSLPIHMSFQRNLSVTTHLNVAKNVDPLKKLEEVTPPSAEVSQDTSSLFTSDDAENIMVEYVQQMLLQMHEATGLPWWASIALTAFLIRGTIVLPFAVTQVRQMAKLEKVNMDLVDIDKKLKKETVKATTEYGWPEHLAKQKYEEAKDKAWWNLVKKENCHPMKAYFLISIQLPAWVVGSCAVYSLCEPRLLSESITKELTTGGFGWITDLTATDPYLILPVAIGLTNLLIIGTHQSFKAIRKSKPDQWKNAGYRVLSLAIIPLASHVPAAVNIYWLSSSIFGLVQAFILNSSPARRLFRVPRNDPALAQPYRYFLKNTKEKLRLSKPETAIVAKE